MENAGPVVLPAATAEVRMLIEDVTRLAEELKVRQERLGELLAPSEAALQARTEYLDRVMREQLGRAGQQILGLTGDVERIARSLNDHVVQIPRHMAEADAQRWERRERRERGLTVLGLLAMLAGGFLAGQVASCRSGVIINTRPAVTPERTSATNTAPSAPRRPAASSSRRIPPPPAR
jgi:hypothetical protein